MSRVFLYLNLLFIASIGLVESKEYFKYDLDVNTDAKGKLELKAKQKTENSKEEIEFKLEGESHGIDAKFKFKADYESAKITSEFRAKIYSVFEFVDTGAEGYDSDDEIVKRMDMEEKDQYSLVSGEVSGRPLSGEEASPVLWASVKYTESAASVTAKAYYSDQASVFGSDSQEVSPSSLKMDFIIENFPYQRDDTKLAIEGRFKSKEKVKLDGQKKVTTKLDTGNGLVDAGFDWKTVVDVDGEEVNLVQSAVSEVTGSDKDATTGDDQEFKTYWTVNKAGQHAIITWDPLIGLQSGSTLLLPAALLLVLYLF